VPGVTPTATESRQVSVVTPATEVGGDPTTVMEVALVTCQVMEYRLGDTSVEHPLYCLPKVLS
jgi:hypothetical protein